MTATRKQIAEALAIHYSKKFNGIVWSAFDTRKRCYFILARGYRRGKT